MPAESFYVPLGGGRFTSTPATAGPWSPAIQHGGPPSALLGRALALHDVRPGLRIARVTLEIPHPVPVGELSLAVRTLRSGRRTELLEGEIVAAGRTVVLARAWRVLVAPPDTPALGHEPPVPDLPGEQLWSGIAGAHTDGYLAAMEWRFVTEKGYKSGGFNDPGPGIGWARQRIPLLPDEPDTPLTRALTLADSSWAVAFELDHRRQLVINTDVTVALHREPVGEWLALRSSTAAGPGGSGLATGRYADRDGDFGVVLQTLLVADR